MAIYTGELDLAEAFAAPLGSDRPDGLWPTVIVDPFDRALGLCYSNLESLREYSDRERDVLVSQTGFVEKGESSGATREVLEIVPDCDRDTLRFRVRQAVGLLSPRYDELRGPVRGIPALEERIRQRQGPLPPVLASASFRTRTCFGRNFGKRRMNSGSANRRGPSGKQPMSSASPPW